jgi:F-box and WD-40 domain protein 1/11
MARFTAQPDEGYSEDPLNALSASTTFSHKSRADAVSALGSSQLADEFPAWLTQHISNLSLSHKTGMSIASSVLPFNPVTVISSHSQLDYFLL